jgi:HSP20 family molecular chaperone IbpA
VKDLVSIRKKDSLWEDLDRMRELITRRAYDLFVANGGCLGRELDDWLAAEKELVWKPAIELREKDNEFILKIAVPGVDPKDLGIEITPEDLLVKAETLKEPDDGKGNLYAGELPAGNLFRSVHFPKKVDTEKVKAGFDNGILTIRAAIAQEAEVKKIKAEAA